MSTSAGAESLFAPYHFQYDYVRSLGPVMTHFFTGLRDRKIFGARTADGRVLAPPPEADPETGASLEDFVEVGPGGEVTTWSWVAEPREKHPLDRPFAWALIRLDGASSAMLHVVDAGSESAMRTGMRVQARWSDSTKGAILDIVCFDPEGA